MRRPFQSTLAPVGASEIGARFLKEPTSRFNPRSHPWVRAKLARYSQASGECCFNPRSHPWVRAKRACACVCARIREVSIHARTRGCERSYRGDTLAVYGKFQSTLAPVGASERIVFFVQCAHVGVSIHARTRGCERNVTIGMTTMAVKFQSTLAPVGASEPLLRQQPD